MYLELDGEGALYHQLARALKHAIVSGRIMPGSRLPSTRELANELRISRNTVKAAYQSLHLDRLAESRIGAGTRVSHLVAPHALARTRRPVAAQSRFVERTRKMPPYASRRRVPNLRYDLQYGEPLVNGSLATAWRTEVARAVANFDWRYPPSEGVPKLRQAVAEHAKLRRGVACDAEDIVIVAGAQQAVSLLTRVLLNEGDNVVVEDPGYDLAGRAMSAHGANVIAVPVDAQGLVVDALPDTHVRLVHVTPAHQFPTGVPMAPGRRRALLEYAKTQDCWIVEDDYDGDYCHDGNGIAALHSLDRDDRVVYIGTFSKVLFPALRLGYLVVPRGLRDDVVVAKTLDDIASPTIEQLALAELMRSGAFDRHLRRAAEELLRRRLALLEGLELHCRDHIRVSDANAGMHVVGWLPAWTVDQVQALRTHAFGRGLGLHPIGPFYRKQPAQAGLLLGYASLSAKQLDGATALLGECLDEIKPDDDEDRILRLPAFAERIQGPNAAAPARHPAPDHLREHLRGRGP
jgi:GntR family transcriptional regulator/MocR family aminotransferase